MRVAILLYTRRCSVSRVSERDILYVRYELNESLRSRQYSHKQGCSADWQVRDTSFPQHGIVSRCTKEEGCLYFGKFGSIQWCIMFIDASLRQWLLQIMRHSEKVKCWIPHYSAQHSNATDFSCLQSENLTSKCKRIIFSGRETNINVSSKGWESKGWSWCI